MKSSPRCKVHRGVQLWLSGTVLVQTYLYTAYVLLSYIKGTVQRQVTGVESGINR